MAKGKSRSRTRSRKGKSTKTRRSSRTCTHRRTSSKSYRHQIRVLRRENACLRLALQTVKNDLALSRTQDRNLRSTVETLTKDAQKLSAHVAQLQKEAHAREKEIARLEAEVKNLSALAAEQQFALVYAPHIRRLLARIATLYEEVGGGVGALLGLGQTQAELVQFITCDLHTPLDGLEDVPGLNASIKKMKHELAHTPPNKKAVGLKKKIVEQALKVVTLQDAAINQYVGTCNLGPR